MVQLGSSYPVSLAVQAITGGLNRSPLSQPSRSCLDDRSRSTLEERFVANYHLGKVRPKPLGPCKGMVSSISSSTESNKSANAQAIDYVSACRNMYFGDDYAGLPINSRGEFIKVHSGGTPNSIDVLKRQCLGENSSCPSAFPTFFTPRTCTNLVNLRPKHHVPQISTVDQPVFHPGSHFTPKAPTAFGMDFSQLPSSERMKTHTYTVPSNKYPCTSQQVLSMDCYCSGCMGQHNPQQKLIGMQSGFLSLNCEQNTQPTAETTMRLMGKTVTLGPSGIQCRGLNSEIPCSNKQSRAEDYSFQGPRTKAFPQLFHEALVDPSSAFRTSDGERQPSENPSFFAFVPAAELRSGLDTKSFRTSGHNQQSEISASNNLYVQPVSCCNDGQWHQQPVMANQVQSNAEDMLLGSMHCRHTQIVAAVPSFDRRNYFRNIVEKGSAPCQSTDRTQQFSKMTQKNPMSSFPLGYDVQSTPGLTTQTKFTSLPPLPPSVIPSHAYSADYAQPQGSTATFHPSIPVSYAANKYNAPGNTFFQDKSMERTMVGSKLEDLERMKRNCKRPAEKDGVLLTLPKKQCIAAVQRDLIWLPLREKGMEICQPRPDAQLLDMHVGFSNEPEADFQLGNKESHTTWSDHVHTMRSVKLKAGAKHVLQSSGSSMGQGNSWPVHSVTQFAVENGACTASTSKTRATEIYEF
uniref:Uncharacterized protein n=1 Tax=Arundo donax TaxID=35708 RepID=A0A0A9DMN8_ARUDO